MSFGSYFFYLFRCSMSPAPLVEYIDYKSLFEQERSEKMVRFQTNNSRLANKFFSEIAGAEPN